MHECKLVCLNCASRQANLRVRTAICGPGYPGDPLDHPLCGTLVRLYKYLLGDFAEELAANLREYTVNSLVVLREREGLQRAMADAQRAQELRQLYGEAVLPQALLDELNGGLGHLRVIGGTESREERAGRVFAALQKHCLQAEEKPATTSASLASESVAIAIGAPTWHTDPRPMTHHPRSTTHLSGLSALPGAICDCKAAIGACDLMSLRLRLQCD